MRTIRLGLALAALVAHAPRVRADRGRFDRAERADRGDRDDRSARVDRTERTDQIDRADRSDRGTSHLADRGQRLDDAWPALPAGHELSLDQKIVDRMTEFGNIATGRLGELTHDAIDIRFDGRHQRAQLRLIAGSARYLLVRMDEDIHVEGSKARIASHVDLTVRGHRFQADLPAVEMTPTSYQGNEGVEVHVALFERRW